MKKIFILIVLAMASTAALSAQSAGAGITVFVPETLFATGDGSISMETGLGTSIGLGNYLSIPVGITYIKAHGLKPYRGESSLYSDKKFETTTSPWFASDSLMLHLMLQFRADLGPVFVMAYGGAVANWLATLTPLESNIESFYNNAENAQITAVSHDYLFGFGYQLGGGFGVKLDSFEIDLSATWKSIGHKGNLKADLFQITDGGPANKEDLDDPVTIFIRGLSIGIGGSISF